MTRRDRMARAIVSGLLNHVRGGALELVDPIGRSHFHERGPVTPGTAIEARVDVHDTRAYERVLREGSVGLGESYADGWWDADDLTSVLRLALRNVRASAERRDALHRLAAS